MAILSYTKWKKLFENESTVAGAKTYVTVYPNIEIVYKNAWMALNYVNSRIFSLIEETFPGKTRKTGNAIIISANAFPEDLGVTDDILIKELAPRPHPPVIYEKLYKSNKIFLEELSKISTESNKTQSVFILKNEYSNYTESQLLDLICSNVADGESLEILKNVKDTVQDYVVLSNLDMLDGKNAGEFISSELEKAVILEGLFNYIKSQKIFKQRLDQSNVISQINSESESLLKDYSNLTESQVLETANQIIKFMNTFRGITRIIKDEKLINKISFDVAKLVNHVDRYPKVKSKLEELVKN
jgi:hypothetical protein